MAFLEKNIKGLIGTVIFHVIIVLITIFFGFTTKLPLPGEEAILISFGTDEDGFGLTLPQIRETAPPVPVTPTSLQSEAENALITQDFEDSHFIETEQTEITAQQNNPDRQVEQSDTTSRTETTAEEVAERVPDRIPNPTALFRGATGTNVTTESSGQSTGAGAQGAATGGDSHRTEGINTGSPEGISFSLAGRSPVTLSLPEFNVQKEIPVVVVVEITVDRNGDVTSARAGVSGATTTMDEALWNAARRAAEQSKFNANPNAAFIQRGTITYTFKNQ